MLSELSLFVLYLLPLVPAQAMLPRSNGLDFHPGLYPRATPSPARRQGNGGVAAAPGAAPVPDDPDAGRQHHLSGGQVAGVASAGGLGALLAGVLGTTKGRGTLRVTACLARGPERCHGTLRARFQRVIAKAERRGQTARAAELRAKMEKFEEMMLPVLQRGRQRARGGRPGPWAARRRWR